MMKIETSPKAFTIRIIALCVGVGIASFLIVRIKESIGVGPEMFAAGALAVILQALAILDAIVFVQDMNRIASLEIDASKKLADIERQKAELRLNQS